VSSYPTGRVPVSDVRLPSEPGFVLVRALTGPAEGRRFRLAVGDCLRFGRADDQDVVLPSSYVSRQQGTLEAGNGHAVLTRAPESVGKMWVQPANATPKGLAPGHAELLPPGVASVRLHTSDSVMERTGVVLDPLGAPALHIVVGPADRDALVSRPSIIPTEERTRGVDDAVRTTAGYVTLVALCAGVLCRGDLVVPDAEEVSRALARIGVRRAPGTCANDFSRLADLFNLRAEGRYVSRDQLARTAIASGWVRVDDVVAAGLVP
jgi:hypothetical protein